MIKEIKQWFVFTRKERIGFAVLVIIVAIVFIVPPLLKTQKTSQPLTEAVKSNDNNSTEGDAKDNNTTNDRSYTSFDENNTSYSLFQFDPNYTSAGDWKKLGLRDKTIKTIHNYLSKGGHFYKPADLKKIYGLREEEFERLQPYIRLEGTSSNKYPERKYENNNYTSSNYNDEKKYPENSAAPQPAYKKKVIQIDINTADTTAWISLPGIGSKLAGRIVNFRDKLGGFYSVQQVAETYGVPDSTFQQIKPMLQLYTVTVLKININTATKDELKMHPYIKWNLANAIVEYRNQHGAFASVDQLTNIVLITPEIYNKISPYLSVN